jgi:phage-related protein
VEYVAYRGEAFTIEWYFDAKGESQALLYFEDLSDQQQDKLLYLFKRMGDFGKISDITKFRYEDDKIYAFKPQPDRFLCFFYAGKKIIVTNAFSKKTDKLPNNEKDLALRSKDDFEKRVKDGKYYEED